ncbi:hypothetical protein BKA69DRAFT_1079844 [Paraphysoderma sedebokerense]|nr:hypothetical protein BKA69DRAFT_1079844 [Paraphysoderma sedebokerense]
MVQQVLKDELPGVFGEYINDPHKYRLKYASEKRNDTPSLIADAESLLLVEPKSKAKAVDMILNGTKNFTDLSPSTHKTAVATYNALLYKFEDTPAAEEFKKRCQKWFPLSSVFNVKKSNA